MTKKKNEVKDEVKLEEVAPALEPTPEPEVTPDKEPVLPYPSPEPNPKNWEYVPPAPYEGPKSIPDGSPELPEALRALDVEPEDEQRRPSEDVRRRRGDVRKHERSIRAAGRALADLIEEHQENNKPLADRAKALLSDVVELTSRIATK